MRKRSSPTYWNPGKKSLPFFFSNESSDEKKKEPDPPSIPQAPSAVENPINTQNPNKITYATSNSQYQILGGMRKELDSMRVSLTIRKPQQQAETPEQT
jgi:hypothetical protein